MNHSMQNETGPMRGVRSGDDVIEEVLNKLDRTPSNPLSAQRAARRFAYREPQCVISVTQPGSTTATEFAVPTRDLSVGGIGFLHGGFIHKGSKCHTYLCTADGERIDIPGTVVRCEYLERMIHEVSVKFDAPIDPAQFCQRSEALRILLVDQDEASAKLVKEQAADLSVEIDRATAGDAVLEKTARNFYDCVLVELAMPGVDMLELVSTLRSGGYARSIVAVTELTDETSEDRAIEAGCDGYLKKPYTAELLARINQTLRESPTGFRAQRAA